MTADDSKRTIKGDDFLRDCVRACQLVYVENMQQAQAAEKMGTSQSRVSRLLAYGREQKFIRIVPPPELTQDFVRVFKERGLRLIVVGDDLESVGDGALRLLEESSFGDGKKIVFDGGGSVGEFCRRPPSKRFSAVTAIAITNDPASVENSAPLVVHEFLRHHDGGSALIPPSEAKGDDKREHDAISRTARAANWVLLGCGPPGENSQRLIQQYSGLTLKQVRARLSKVAAVCGNELLDADGKPIDATGLLPRPVLKVKNLREMSKRSGKTVALIATGVHKTDAILAALNSGLANTFVLGVSLAHRVCEQLERTT